MRTQLCRLVARTDCHLKRDLIDKRRTVARAGVTLRGAIHWSFSSIPVMFLYDRLVRIVQNYDQSNPGLPLNLVLNGNFFPQRKFTSLIETHPGDFL